MATKKQTKSKKKIRRRMKVQEKTERSTFLERVKRHKAAAGKEIRIEPPNRVKMSQVILDFAAPLLERFEPEVPAQELIAMAILAWNLALTPDEEHERFMNEVAGTLSLDAEGAREMNEMMKWLVERKRKYFAEHRRQILDYRLSDFGDRRGLQVVSVGFPADRESDLESGPG